MAKQNAPSTNTNKVSTTSSNRTSRVSKHIKNNPNDKYAEQMLNREGAGRKKPITEHWTKRDIAAVKLYKLAGLSGKDFIADKIKHKKSLSASKSGTTSNG